MTEVPKVQVLPSHVSAIYGSCIGVPHAVLRMIGFLWGGVGGRTPPKGQSPAKIGSHGMYPGRAWLAIFFSLCCTELIGLLQPWALWPFRVNFRVMGRVPGISWMCF